MRIALVSPYSWTYPGGVTRHIESLAERYLAIGHDVRVLAPVDPPGRLSTRLHGGAAPAARDLPEWLIPLGRTIGVPSNGAVSNLSPLPSAVRTLRRELRAGAYDVVHVHEPVAPVVGWDALRAVDAPLVGTFHCYSTSAAAHGVANLLGARWRLNHLHGRIAVSEAAAWTGRRFYGGRYRIIPNGVDASRPPDPQESAAISASRPLCLVFVGQSVERKGLPGLLRAYEALREHLPVRLEVVGVTHDELEPLMLDSRGVTARGKCSDAVKRSVLESADLLCAPSLGGESFGMVLTEGFAAGTPVVASDIAGYRDVVTDGIDGVLVPPGDAAALAETLRVLALAPERRDALAAAAARAAQRYDWSRVADEVLDAYGDAIATPVPAERGSRIAARIGLAPADGAPREPVRRLPSLGPAAGVGATGRAAATARRVAVGASTVLAAVMAVLVLQRVGIDAIVRALVEATSVWVLVGLGLMCASEALRGVAWHAILRAALPKTQVRRADALQGTFIGVLMSATLPARLGEPARAMVVARRLGGARDHFPVVLGTIVSQTLLNVVALAALGIVMFSSVDLFTNIGGLAMLTLAPAALLAIVLVAPVLLRSGKASRYWRLARVAARVHAAMIEMRAGLLVFRHPRLGAQAAVTQLSSWALQLASCYVLLIAMGIEDTAGIAAAAAVLFAVNVTAVVPLTPSNLGVFQAACVTVLAVYGVSAEAALAYGIILQAVEMATALVMGAPALVREGASWKDVRLRAMHAAPVELPVSQSSSV